MSVPILTTSNNLAKKDLKEVIKIRMP
jgi:hypothetical protein